METLEAKVLKVFMYVLVTVCAVILIIGAFVPDLIGDTVFSIAFAGMFIDIFILCPIHFVLESGTF